MLYYIASMTKKERWDGRSRVSTPEYKDNYNRIFGPKEKPGKSTGSRNEPATRIKQMEQLKHDPITD